MYILTSKAESRGKVWRTILNVSSYLPFAIITNLKKKNYNLCKLKFNTQILNENCFLFYIFRMSVGTGQQKDQE